MVPRVVLHQRSPQVPACQNLVKRPVLDKVSEGGVHLIPQRAATRRKRDAIFHAADRFAHQLHVIGNAAVIQGYGRIQQDRVQSSVAQI